ncbi:MAG TPA: protein kinase [Polyangiaceae bacterium]|nr:protein kinase [Polyangiaceae bacterium]
MLATGTILDNKYRLDRPIGRGGMGMVWLAERLGWHAPVAVKLIHLELLQANPKSPLRPELRPALLQRFFSEASTTAAIRSPHVVQILDHGVDSTLGLPFIVMELLDGETLEQRLHREPRLSTTSIAHLFSHVSRALTRLHEARMVHRDLKPSNIFLTKNEDEIVVKLLDFGITKTHAGALSEAPITATGEQLGTPYYMSPEQIRGSKQIDFRADIWAMGVIAFECFTGQRPFDGDTLGDLTLKICVEPIPAPSGFAPVPEGFDEWFLRAVSRDRSRTFGSAREAVDALKVVSTHTAFAGTTQVSANATAANQGPTHTQKLEIALTTAALSPVRPAATKTRSARVLALGGSAGLLTVALAFTAFNWSNEKPGQAPTASVSMAPKDQRALPPVPSGSTALDTVRAVVPPAFSARLAPTASAPPSRAAVSSSRSRAAVPAPRSSPRRALPAPAASSNGSSATAPPDRLLQDRL